MSGIEPWHVVELRDSMGTTPGAANNLIRSLSSLMSWCVPRGWRSHNPCAHVKKLKLGAGAQPWSWEEIEHFRQYGRADLWQAAALALYTGQRQSDVLAMSWSHLSGGLISVRQGKTGKFLELPMHRDLAVVLEQIPRKQATILTNTRGETWTGDGFRASWQADMQRPDQARLKERGLVFHGLRKSAVVMLLEAGCSDAEVAAVTGQSRQMVEYYARQVSQRRLAAAAILKWEKQ